MQLASTPKPPYYAVIFTSIQTTTLEGYQAMARHMDELVEKQPGFLGYESAREELGITVSYWESLEAIEAWKNQLTHRLAQQKGKEEWYSQYYVCICKVERDYSFQKEYFAK